MEASAPCKEPSISKSEDQGLDDARWRALMLTTVSCLSDVHLKLMSAMEELLWKSSPEDLGASTKAHTSQVRSLRSR